VLAKFAASCARAGVFDEVAPRLLTHPDVPVWVRLRVAHRSASSVADAAGLLPVDDRSAFSVLSTYVRMCQRWDAVRPEVVEAIFSRSDLSERLSALLGWFA